MENEDTTPNPNKEIWKSYEFGEDAIPYRKLLVREARQRQIQSKISRIGKGRCKVSLYCTPSELADVESTTEQKLAEKLKLSSSKESPDSIWNVYQASDEDREYRDTLARCARSKRFKVKAGRNPEGLWCVSIFCTEPRYQDLHVEAEQKLQQRLENGGLDLNKKQIKPDIMEQKKLTMIHLNILLEALHHALALQEENPDDFFAEVNMAGKMLYGELKQLSGEGRHITLNFKNGNTRYVRWIGERFKMFFFTASGERNPYIYTVSKHDAIDLSQVEEISIN